MKYGIKCVNVVCGNLFVLHQEEFVHGVHNIIHNFVNYTLYDEYWVLEMYPFLTEYIKLLTDKPAFLLPYVWSDTVIKKYILYNKLNVEFDYHEVSRNKINILIYEPNMSVHKTALIPLLIAENYSLRYPGKLHKVFVFCGTNVVTLMNQNFIQNLNIFKNGYLEAYDRMIMPNTLELIKSNNNFINVVVSHNIMNNLNFLHLEMMTLDIPIIHNCEPFKQNKLYYDDYSLTCAVDLVDWVRTDFYLNSDYRTNVYEVKNKFHPHTFHRQETYKAHIQRITGVYLQEPHDELGTTVQLVDSFAKITSFIHQQHQLENILFYNDVGIVILLTNENELDLLTATLHNLVSCENKLRVEIVTSNEIIDILKIDHICKQIKQNNFVIDVLNLADDTDASQEPNPFMACVFSNFEYGIFIEPGTLFIQTPINMIEYYLNNEKNSFSFMSSCFKFNSLQKIDKDIFTSISTSLRLDHIDTYEHINHVNILFFNKKDVTCLKILGTMCELRKINAYLVDHVNILDIVCALNYGNKYSKIKESPFVYGIVDDKFKGYGLCYKCDNTFGILTQKHQLPIQQDTKYVIIPTDDNKIKPKYVDDTYIGFTGKVPARKMPDIIKSVFQI
jgi:hypothetical protein